MNTLNRSKRALMKALCRITDVKEMDSVLQCILTPNEIHEIENRLRIFEMLDKQMPQREIAASLGVGIATVTRGAQAFKSGQFDVLKRYLRASGNGDKSSR